jgi:hypothetical protein
MLPSSPALVLAALSILAGCAAAQTVPPTASASPAAAPAYRSALDGYRPFADESPGSWKEANDNVGRIGGWRVYAREARGGASAPAAPSSAPAAPSSSPKPAAAPGGHRGHGKH